MRAVVLESYGGPEVLQVLEVPDPLPGPEEIRVRVVATGLNRADLLQRMGLYPGPPMAHEIPGLEFAGVVDRLGERVDRWAVGDTVMGIVAGGAHAEFVVIHERQAMPVPDGMAPADAAAIPEVFITAFDALVAQGGLTGGRRALVHAGASGVGTASIQIARAIGAQVAVTTSSRKLAACRDLGADLVIDYSTADFVSQVRDWTAGGGVDVILDVVGGDYLDRNLACLSQGGTIVQVGVMGGGRSEVNLGRLLTSRAHLIGTTLRSRPIEAKIGISTRFATEMLWRFSDGGLHPVIDSRFPLDEMAAAHRLLASNETIGKVVIDVVADAPPGNVGGAGGVG